MRGIFILTAVATLLGLSACERAIIGGAIGCAAGEVYKDGKCVEGAVIGAGVGALTK